MMSMLYAEMRKGGRAMTCTACGISVSDPASASAIFETVEGADNNRAPVAICPGCVASLGNGDATLAVLIAYVNNDGADDWMMGNGYVAQVGRYLYVEDESGYRDWEEYPDVAAARKRYVDLYSDGCGASEDDAYISYDWRRGGWQVMFGHQNLGAFERESRAKAAVSLAMRREGYFPNVWIVGERGDLQLTQVW